MKVATVIFVEFLKQTGFVEGFLHGAARKTTHDILESETMNLILDKVINIISEQPRSITVNKGQVKLIAKLALECPIQIQKHNKSSHNSTTNVVDILFSDELISKTAKALSCSNEEAEVITKILLNMMHDNEMLGKPCYTIGNNTGEFFISASRAAANSMFCYEEEKSTCCSTFMNTVTCGCWGWFFKKAPASQDNMQENIRTVMAIDIDHSHPGLTRRNMAIRD